MRERPALFLGLLADQPELIAEVGVLRWRAAGSVGTPGPWIESTARDTGRDGLPLTLVAMDLEQATPRHVVIAGDRNAPETQAMVAEFDRRFLPHDALLLVGSPRLAEIAPFTAPLVAQDGRATAYVCVQHTCRLPTRDVAQLGAMLDERSDTRVPQGDPR